VCDCGHAKARIGESVSEKLEYQPASFVVIETARAKYACPQCHAGVVEAPAPPQAVEKSLAAEGLLAHVVVSKYVDHLPLHRLSGIFARQRVELSRTTLCDWIADVATALAPIGAQLRREITAATYLQTDDTTVTVLDDRGGSFKGRLWTYLDPLGRQVVFNAPGQRPSWPGSRARSKPTPIPATTRCIETGTCARSGAGPTGVAGSSRRS
jgi:transposase